MGRVAGDRRGSAALATPVGRAGASAVVAAGRSEAGARRSLSVLGRVGLAGRTGFYLILTCITARIAALGGRGARQADANGALSLVSRPAIGKVAIAMVAIGFLLFGVGRLVGAVEDAAVGRRRRAMTALQGVFYLAMAWVPASFLAGNHQTGTQQQQQHTTARLMGLPGGRWIVATVGVVFVVVCAQQIRGALGQDFVDGLDLRRAPRAVHAVVRSAGTVGITCRALVFLPVGVFLVVAAVAYDPRHAIGTDGELLRLSSRPWGVAVLCAVTAGLGVFCVYSAIEARYRTVVSAR